MKVYQIISEATTPRLVQDAGKWKWRLPDGSMLGGFPDQKAAMDWAKKNPGSLNPSTPATTAQAKPDPTAKQLTKIENRLKALEKAAPYNKSGWGPKWSKWATGILTLVGIVPLATSWVKEWKQHEADAKDVFPDANLKKFQDQYLTPDKRAYDLTKVTADQIWEAVNSSTMTPEAKTEYYRIAEAKKTAQKQYTEAAAVAATFVAAMLSQTAIAKKFVNSIRLGLAGGGAAAGFLALGAGVPAAAGVAAAMFGALAVETAAGGLAVLLSTELGKKYVTEWILAAAGVLVNEENIQQGTQVIKQAVSTDPRAGTTAPSQTQEPTDYSADAIKKRMGVD